MYLLLFLFVLFDSGGSEELEDGTAYEIEGDHYGEESKNTPGEQEKVFTQFILTIPLRNISFGWSKKFL